MANANQNKGWSNQNPSLKKMIAQNTPTRVMAWKLGRSAGAVQQQANKLGLSTKPTNQSPYNRRKK